MLLLLSARLDAYVDPGIVGALFQSAYAMVFAAVSLWILRPWRYVRSLFRWRASRTDSKRSGR